MQLLYHYTWIRCPILYGGIEKVMIDKYRIVALCMSKVYLKENHELIEALSELLKQNDGRLFVYCTNTDFVWDTPERAGEKLVFDYIPYDRLDAIIIHEEGFKTKDFISGIVNSAKQYDIPVVVIGEAIKGCMQIRFDYAAGFEKIVRHVLMRHRVKQPHFMGGMPDNPFSIERERVFAEVLTERGYMFDKSKMVSYGEFWEAPTIDAMNEIFKRRVKPDAIFCGNDKMAMTVVSVLAKHGYNVPDDVIVTGFDGIEDIYYSNPQITSCKCDSAAMAEGIVDYLMEYFDGTSLPEKVMIEPTLIKAESCGCGEHIKANPAERINTLETRVNTLLEREAAFQSIYRLIEGNANIGESVSYVAQQYLHNVKVLVSDKYIGRAHNPMMVYAAEKHDDFKLIFDSDSIDSSISDFDIDEMIPNLEAILEKGGPVFFTGINRYEELLGLVAFCPDEAKRDYLFLIPQITMVWENVVTEYMRKNYYSHSTDGKCDCNV